MLNNLSSFVLKYPRINKSKFWKCTSQAAQKHNWISTGCEVIQTLCFMLPELSVKCTKKSVI